MTDTPNFKLTELSLTQASKELTVNQNMREIDAFMSHIVESYASSPPGSPVEGQVYIVSSGATGTFAGNDHSLATWINGGWYFLEPPIGHVVYKKDTNEFLLYKAANTWIKLQIFDINETNIVSSSAVGTGIAVIAATSAYEINNRTLVAGNGINISVTPSNEIEFEVTPLTLSAYGNGTDVLISASSREIISRTLVAGNGINISVTPSNEIEFEVTPLTLSAQGSGITFIGIVSSREITQRVLDSTSTIDFDINNGIVTGNVIPKGIYWDIHIFNTTTHPGIVEISGNYNNSILIAEDGVTFSIKEDNWSNGGTFLVYFESAAGSVSANTGVSILPTEITNVSAHTSYSFIRKTANTYLVM